MAHDVKKHCVRYLLSNMNKNEAIIFIYQLPFLSYMTQISLIIWFALVFSLGIFWWMRQVCFTYDPFSCFPVLQWLKSYRFHFADIFIAGTPDVIQTWWTWCTLMNSGRQRWDGNWTSAVSAGKFGSGIWVFCSSSMSMNSMIVSWRRTWGIHFAGGDHSAVLGLPWMQ